MINIVQLRSLIRLLSRATPDGRFDGEVLTDGAASPAQGCDTNGPAIAIWCGGNAPMLFPWTSSGSVNLGNLQGAFDNDLAYSSTYFAGATQLVFFTLLFIVLCIIFKGFKPSVKAMESLKMEPPKFTKIQYHTMVTIIITLIVIIVPTFIQVIAPNSVT